MEPFFSQEPSRKRFKHDESTMEIKNIVDNLNQQFEGNFKVMIYWSRYAVAFMAYDDSVEKLKQAPGFETRLCLIYMWERLKYGGRRNFIL